MWRPQLARHFAYVPITNSVYHRSIRSSASFASNSSFANGLLEVPPQYLAIKSPPPLNQSLQQFQKTRGFTEMFRSMAPYINFHRGKTMVIHIPGQLVDSTTLSSVMQDLALLHTFGIKLVLVAGCRPQMDEQLSLHKLSPWFDSGIRITGPEELKCAMDAAGSVRFRIESVLGRGIVNSPSRDTAISIASGNFITAQPIGVRGGVDFKNTGEMRKLNVDKVKDSLDSGDIVLVSSIGYSASGEVFNCISEHIATKCATQLGSDKLIFLHDGEELFDVRTNQIVHALSIQQAQEYMTLAREREMANKRNQSLADKVLDNAEHSNPGPKRENDYSGAYGSNNTTFLRYMNQSIKACVNGVNRAHIVSRHLDGGLLLELFTRDGEGIMISKNMYEGVRMATPNDIVSIMRLIQPLLDADVLVSRNQEQIESNVHTFAVVERDGAIIACAALQPYENRFAEMACVAVDPAYRSLGKGNALLGFILRKARTMGVEKVFVLTTRTSHWFLERGFQPAEVGDLPPSKQKSINMSRQSKVYIIDISCQRTLDEKELLLKL